MFLKQSVRLIYGWYIHSTRVFLQLQICPVHLVEVAKLSSDNLVEAVQ